MIKGEKMVVKLVKKGDEIYNTGDLVQKLKKNDKIDTTGAIFTFEGFVRGFEDDSKIKDLSLSTPDIDKTQKELEEIVNDVETKYSVEEISVVHYLGKFYTGDSLFLVAVLGGHREDTLRALQEVIERVKFDLDFKKEEVSDSGTKVILAGG
ncbi:molybdopterin synthase catalytic subunit [Methanobrevibacter curvatus]|uniref:Molybdopterin synthase catalytic subunit n=2 Tax=Methanobrevibacter curvatus TaxID=49547 RepID=A0A166B174_9EURY|nr:molybdopterin synthase catalytic subunit [Methanobrevibacter curvatus]